MDKRVSTRLETEEYEEFIEFCERENFKISEGLRYILNRYLDNYYGSMGE